MEVISISKIDNTFIDDSNLIYIHGWITQIRKQQDNCFIQINDGSNHNGIQLVCHKENSMFELCSIYTNGSYIKCRGSVVKSPTAKQEIEFLLDSIIDFGPCNSVLYPIKKKNNIENLRRIPHLRCRTKLFGCVMRIRNKVMYETHNFFQKNNFLHLDPNVLTINECEGGAGVFQATEWCPKQIRDIPAREGIIQWKKDHFKKPVYLTVSSQLQLEALACSMGNVYTTNKSFRAEHSLTNKHMSEFTHLEIEAIDCVNEDLMSYGESYVNHIIKQVYDTCYHDIFELNKFMCKGLLDRFNKLLSLQYYRVSYKECITKLNDNGFEIKYGSDISSEMEHFLCKLYNGAVFVTNWPFSIKSFYMKRRPDNTCESFDLLMPYEIGELIGGSMREENIDVLKKSMNDKNVLHDGLEWYLDLRRFGTVKHGGFGLGLDRLLMLVTGMRSIKDVVPIPVYYQNCHY